MKKLTVKERLINGTKFMYGGYLWSKGIRNNKLPVLEELSEEQLRYFHGLAKAKAYEELDTLFSMMPDAKDTDMVEWYEIPMKKLADMLMESAKPYTLTNNGWERSAK